LTLTVSVPFQDTADTIARLERRRDALEQDIVTVTAHARDLISIGERRYGREEAPEALALRLKTLPALVPQTHTVPLGVYRGLTFGLVLHPQGAPEIYVEGALRRCAQLARDFHGSRAILNAVERLIGSLEGEREKTVRDFGIAQGQRRDYEAHLGASFAHTGYLDELTSLRNQLESALSNTAQQGSDAALPDVRAIVERIKTLTATHTLDAAPERAAPRPIATVAEAITTRIRQREQAEATPQPDGQPAPVTPATTAPQPPTAPEPPATPGQAPPAPWAPPQQLRLF
jgi:hypothetical protein